MALQLPTAITFSTKLEGTGLDQLKRNLQGLAQQSNRTTKDLDQLYNASRKLSAAAGTSINSLNRQVQVLTTLRNEAALGSRQFKFYTAELEKLQRQQTKLNSSGSGQGGLLASIGGLRGGLAGAAALAGTLGATQVVGGIAKASMEAETARVRLKALTDTYGEYNQAQQIASKIAGTLRITNTEATDSFAKLYAGLRPTGVGMKELEQIFVGFSVAARTSGATAEETSAAMIQLKQALVSGRAQGDELRSILEQAPALGQAVAEQMTKLGTFGKVTRAQLKDLGAEGKISTDVLIAALAELGEKELPKLQKSFNTGQQAVADLGTATNKLQTAIGDAFGPIAIGLVKSFASVVNKAADAMERFNKFNLDRGNDAVAYEQAVRNANKKFFNNETAGGLINFLTPGYKEFVDKEYQRLQQQQQAQKEQGATADQLAARKQADAEREAARTAGAREDAKKRLGEQLKIREDAEKRLADFREQSIQRAAQLERDLGDQRQELERSIAEARTRIARQQEDRELERQRRQLRAQGLGTEGVDAAARVRDIMRGLQDETLQAQQNATDRKVQIERTLADYQLSVARGISEILQDAADKMAQKMLEGAQAAADATQGQTPSGDTYNQPGVGYFSRSSGAFLGKALPSAATGATSMGGGIGSGFTQQQLNSATQAASKFAGVANMCSESVKTFYKSLGITLPGVTAWADTVRKAGTVMRDWSKLKPGDIVATGRPGDTPHVGVYTGENNVFHQSRSRGLRAGNFPDLDYFKQSGYFVRPSSGTPMAGAASAVPAASASVDMSGVTAAGLAATARIGRGVDAAGQRLDAAVGVNQRVQIQAAQGNAAGLLDADLSQMTSQLDSQLKSSTEQLQNYERMVQLQRSGLSPELARQRADLETMARTEQDGLQRRGQQLEIERQKTVEGSTQRQMLDDAIRLNDDAISRNSGIVDQIMRQNAALEQQQILQERNKQLVDGIANSIGNGVGQAFDTLLEGTNNWGDSLRSIAANVLKDIARQLFQILVIEQLISAVKGALGSILPGGGGGAGIAGGQAILAAANGYAFDRAGTQQFAMGGIVNQPTLFRFADGGGFRTGLMGEAGPEAIMPLKRGADGKLGVQIVNSNPQNIQAAKQPVAEAVLQPVVKSSIAAVKQPIAEALLQSVSKSSIAAAKQPVAEAVLQPVIKSPVDAIKQPDAAVNTIRPFANDGIVDSPTLFKFANGGVMRDGLMGEAGPEAILPLKRGRGGKLGVAMQGEGGGSTNVTVNVDATGSSVEGDQAQGKQLGVAISAAVQAELIKQQRPGGLLAGNRR